jgi:hypothetical protein
VDFRYCAKEPTAAEWHIVDMQTDHGDLSDRSVVTATWDVMRQATAGVIYPAGEAFLGFSTL